MGEIDVKLLNNTISSTTFAVSTSFISFDYDDGIDDDVTVYVDTDFQKTTFDKTTDKCPDNGIVTFTGDTNNNAKHFEVDITNDKTSDSWLSAAIISAQTNGGSFSVYCTPNNTENDRYAQVNIYYNKQIKKINVVQFADVSYVTYVVTSDAMDGAVVTFKDSGASEYEKVTLVDGIAEYTRRKVGAPNPMPFTIEGGLPDSSITYSIINENGVTASSISNSGQENFKPDISGSCETTFYSYDDKIYSNIYSGSVSYGEREDVPINKITDEKPADIDVTVPSSYNWIEKSKIIPCVNVAKNSNINMERSAILTYYVIDSPSTSLRYKISQTKGNYVFRFSGETIQTKSIDLNTYDETTTGITIESYLNDNPNDVVPFTYTANNDEVLVEKNGGNITFKLSYNYLTSNRTINVTFVQSTSNKTLRLKLIQPPVECKIGDVYSYNASTRQYAYFRLLKNRTTNGFIPSIVSGFSPIGIVVMPFNNNATTSPEYARIISLNEKKNTDGSDYHWKKADYEYDTKHEFNGYGKDENFYSNNGNAKRYKCLTLIGKNIDSINTYNLDNIVENDYEALGSVNSYSIYYYLNKTNNLYYAKTIYKAYKKDDDSGSMRHTPQFTNDDTTLNAESYSGKFNADFFNFQGSAKGYKLSEIGYFDFDGKTDFKNISKHCQKNDSNHYKESLYYYISNYKTIGNTEGEWYLGAAGEMAYICIYAALINSVLDKLKSLSYDTMNLATNDTNSRLNGAVGRSHTHTKNYDLSDECYWTSTPRLRQSGDRRNASALVMAGNGMITWEYHRRLDNNGTRRYKRIRPMLMVNKQNQFR